MDDSLLAGESFEECLDNIRATFKMLSDLGFFIHPDKSVFTPSQVIECLGFIINTIQMTLSLTEKKKQKI